MWRPAVHTKLWRNAATPVSWLQVLGLGLGMTVHVVTFQCEDAEETQPTPGDATTGDD